MVLQELLPDHAAWGSDRLYTQYEQETNHDQVIAWRSETGLIAQAVAVHKLYGLDALGS